MMNRKKIEQATFHNLEGSIEGKRWKIYRVFNRERGGPLPSLPTFLLKWFSRWDCVAAPFPRDQILRRAACKWPSDSRPNWRRVIADNRSFSFLCPAIRISAYAFEPKFYRSISDKVEMAGSSGPFDAPPRFKKKSTSKIHFLLLLNLLLSGKIDIDDEFLTRKIGWTKRRKVGQSERGIVDLGSLRYVSCFR